MCLGVGLAMRCQECGSLIVSSHSALVCEGCGLVVEEGSPTPGAEWVAYTAEQWAKRARVGAPLRPGSEAPATSIKWGDVVRLGVTQTQKRDILILAKLNGKMHPKPGVGRIAREVKRAAYPLHLPPHVVELALSLADQAKAAGITRGKPASASAAALILLAARLAPVPLRQDLVAAYFPHRVKLTLKIYRDLVRKLGVRPPPPTPLSYVASITSALRLPPHVTEEAEEITATHRLQGCSPRGIAAASVYIAAKRAGFKLSQSQVAEAAGVTDITVRHLAHRIDPALNTRNPTPQAPRPAAEARRREPAPPQVAAPPTHPEHSESGGEGRISTAPTQAKPRRRGGDSAWTEAPAAPTVTQKPRRPPAAGASRLIEC
jgi:transcription initiation factor TFIIB